MRVSLHSMVRILHYNLKAKGSKYESNLPACGGMVASIKRSKTLQWGELMQFVAPFRKSVVNQ